MPSSKKKLPEDEEAKQEIVQEALELDKEMLEEEVKLDKEVLEGEIKEVKKESIFEKEAWQPRTLLGKSVKNGEIITIDDLLNSGKKIIETEIIDLLLPNLELEIIEAGQQRGKFGGGKRTIWKQTQKKTKEGNKPKFTSFVVIGNKMGYVGIGRGKAKETRPAREKAVRKAKLNIIKIKTGCGSWSCNCKEPHSVPFKVSGKCGSVHVQLVPAPKGTSLCCEDECKKLMTLAGIKDVYIKIVGNSRAKINLITASFLALKKLSQVKVK